MKYNNYITKNHKIKIKKKKKKTELYFENILLLYYFIPTN